MVEGWCMMTLAATDIAWGISLLVAKLKDGSSGTDHIISSGFYQTPKRGNNHFMEILHFLGLSQRKDVIIEVLVLSLRR